MLLALLTGPTQDQKRGRIITVAVNRAFSAAASFLALGSYAVALPHASILYHDVRYGGMEDVTPTKAKDAAEALQVANDSFALRLARTVIARLMWVYLDVYRNFDDIKKDWPRTHAKYAKIIDLFSQPSSDSADLALFATSLFAALSKANEGLITTVMEQLGSWIGMTKLLADVKSYRQKGSRIPGLLDGAKHLNSSLVGNGSSSKAFNELENHLKLLMGLIAVRLADPKWQEESEFSKLLEQVSRDQKLIESMDDLKHQKSANALMLQYEEVFFGRSIKQEIAGKTEEEKQKILSLAAPQARLFWCFCVLLCRELFRGDHVLSPNDAQVLGLVNEVAGGAKIESLREFYVRKKTEQESSQAKAA